MTEYLKAASMSSRIVPGFNVFGYEDAAAVIRAAERFNAPVILMSNSDSVEHIDPRHSADLFRSLAESTEIPVIIHLDHAKTLELILHAVDSGYTSVMYDGSALPLEENIENTCRVLDIASKKGVSVEAELGSVPYTDRNADVKSILTDPSEAGEFIEKAPVNALAVAVGSLHRMQEKAAKLDFERLAAIESYTDVPLVIHGASGIVEEDFIRLLPTRVGKVNIGTVLRMAFGKSLKEEIAEKPEEYDRVKLFKKPMQAVEAAAVENYRLLGWEEIC
ncbi:MAG: class II fructose-bisphosphate aldolase [Spirochaetales bacterium]|uniref:Class II fructose-bisphosphate aldolase n=1 Tax=Candidatus Thalassospirochaeta sargassi TaxID=3119039 RepID=A0AAJ1MNL0_9SPIO|nr:class II fructose-bisphosphate aldolase [Spirochaetales bacterium]